MRTGGRRRVGLACSDFVRRRYIDSADLERLQPFADFFYEPFSAGSELMHQAPRDPAAEATLATFAADLDVLVVCHGAPFVSGDVLSENLLEPALREAGRILPRDQRPVIDGFAAQNGGKPNHVWDVIHQQVALGRFGWKANQPSVEQQVMGASRNDMGITDSAFPTENCPPLQTACAAAPAALDQPNLEALRESSLIVHALGLAVPARRNIEDPVARNGERLFAFAGCGTCHIPKMTTGTLPNWPEMSNQTIRPFTDLLLHDMGPDLADGRPDYEASGSEWRTPPLWGLGLVQPIDGYLFLMHDGRARGFAEAILWHGGQAETAREAFRTMPTGDRAALIAFLSSL